MDVLSWPIVGWLIRAGWTVLTAIRGHPRVSYVGDGSGFVAVEGDGTLRVGIMRAKLRNDGKEHTTLQEVWVELVTDKGLHILEAEKGWDIEFIGHSIDGHGGQLLIYPHFLLKNADVQLNTDVTATLKVRVWPKTIIKKKLRLTWK